MIIVPAEYVLFLMEMGFAAQYTSALSFIKRFNAFIEALLSCSRRYAFAGPAVTGPASTAPEAVAIFSTFVRLAWNGWFTVITFTPICMGSVCAVTSYGRCGGPPGYSRKSG